MSYTFVDYYYEDGIHPDDKILKSLSELLEDIVYYLKPFQFIFACIGFIFNILHVLVVSRKPLRSISVYVIMIGIGVCDLYTMLTVIHRLLNEYIALFNGTDCYIPPGYWKTVINFWIGCLMDVFRRLSTWLALLMALVRLLIIKNPMNSNCISLSSPSFAYTCISIITFISFTITFFNWGQYSIVDNGPMKIRFCKYLPKNYTVPHTYTYEMAEFVDDFRPLAMKYTKFSDGISKIIPTLLLPFFSFSLIRYVQKVSKSSKNLMKLSKDREAEKSIKMVTIMTVFSMIAEGPTGVLSAIQTFYLDYSAIS
ncbi:unnamed protein product [Caenorhabditis brenneri]